MKFLVAVSLLMVSCAVAQQAYKCTTPPVWYAHFYDHSPARNEERHGTFYYDEENERIAIREERTQGLPTNTTYYREIFLHKEKVGYRIENGTNFCTRFPLNEPFPKIGPYLNDEYDGEFYIGSSAKPKDGVKVVAYSGTIPERGSFFGVWVPVDETTCFPVRESFTRVSERIASSRSYYDVRLGIFDTSVFEPPSTCVQPPPPGL